MTCMRLLTLAVTLLLPAATPADEKAATPEDLVALLQTARKAGDPKAELRLIGGPHRALVEQALEVLEAGKAFDKALDDRFGKDPNCRSWYALQPEPAKRVELKGKKDLGGGKIELTIWTIGKTVEESREVAVRENGGWVLLARVPFTCTVSTKETRTVDGQQVTVHVEGKVPELTPDQLVAARAALPQMRIQLDRGTKDVAARKHATRKDAVAAVDKAVEDVVTVEQGKATNGGKKEPK